MEKQRSYLQENAAYLWNDKKGGAMSEGLETVKTRVDEDGTFYGTVSAPIVRKAAQGRPNYVKAPNVLFGNPRNFYRLPEKNSQRP